MSTSERPSEILRRAADTARASGLDARAALSVEERQQRRAIKLAARHAVAHGPAMASVASEAAGCFGRGLVVGGVLGVVVVVANIFGDRRKR